MRSRKIWTSKDYFSQENNSRLLSWLSIGSHEKINTLRALNSRFTILCLIPEQIVERTELYVEMITTPGRESTKTSWSKQVILRGTESSARKKGEDMWETCRGRRRGCWGGGTRDHEWGASQCRWCARRLQRNPRPWRSQWTGRRSRAEELQVEIGGRCSMLCLPP